MKRAITIAAMLAAAGLAGAQMFAQLFAATSTARLPAGYRECKYIESTGTQYIDTGLKTTKSTSFYIDFDWLNGAASGWIIYGISTADNSGIGLTMSYGGANYGFRTFGATVGGGAWVGGVTNRVIASTTSAAPNVLLIGGSAKATATQSSSATTAAYNLHVFGQMLNGTVTTITKARAYSLRFYEAGVPVRDFVPCLNPSNVPGMYDLVGGVFYDNDGTGSFDYELK